MSAAAKKESPLSAGIDDEQLEQLVRSVTGDEGGGLTALAVMEGVQQDMDVLLYAIRASAEEPRRLPLTMEQIAPMMQRMLHRMDLAAGLQVRGRR